MRFSAGGLDFDVRVEGDPAGETVVLLHGFPQTAAAWDRVWPRLAAAGYRTVLPDQRGYSPGARPAGRRAYRMPELVGDLVALLDELGTERAHLVGHDWGGAVAWAAAGQRPDRLQSVTVVSTPHPRAMATALALGPQLVRSAYIGFFQLPLLPEAVLRAGRGRVLRGLLRRSGLAAARADAYVDRLLEPGALTAALNWYRAIPLHGPGAAAPGSVELPTLYVWGDADPALGRAAASRTGGHVAGPYTFVQVPGGSHWIPEEHPDALVGPLLQHLSSAAAR
jgi:pimeloyl-ACP methyl ester carboxylesterase